MPTPAMRLVEFTGSQGLPHNRFPRALKDMQGLYGGQIIKDRNPVTNKKERRLTTPDGLILAQARGLETVVGVKKLDQQFSVVRWIALQAYKERGGQDFGYFQTEVPDIRAYHEWHDRRAKATREAQLLADAEHDRAVSALIEDATLSEEEFARLHEEAYRQKATRDAQIVHGSQIGDFFANTSAGSGNDPESRFFKALIDNTNKLIDTVAEAEAAGARGDDVGVEMALRAYVGEMAVQDAAPEGPPPELPHTHTVFFAKGATLPAAARVMAQNYGDLLFHANDPDVTVSQALGVASLNHLDHMWEGAMTQRTPRAAGQFVLQSLIQE